MPQQVRAQDLIRVLVLVLASGAPEVPKPIHIRILVRVLAPERVLQAVM